MASSSAPPAISKYSVMLIDDDVELAQMLAEYLALDAYSVALAHDGHSADALLQQRSFDITLLDLMLPDINGLDLLRRYRLWSQRPVIMLSAHGNEADRVLGLESGADDYLSKPFGPRELKARIQAILRRTNEHSSQPPHTLQLGVLSLATATGEVGYDGKVVTLTGAEQRVLEILIRAPGQIVSRQDIGRHALGRVPEAYDRSVETHISSLRRKLGLDQDGSTILLRNLRGQGYVLALRSPPR